MIHAASELKWHCPFGMWAPLTGAIPRPGLSPDFTGCPYGCPRGTFGDRPNITSSQDFGGAKEHLEQLSERLDASSLERLDAVLSQLSPPRDVLALQSTLASRIPHIISVVYHPDGSDHQLAATVRDIRDKQSLLKATNKSGRIALWVPRQRSNKATALSWENVPPSSTAESSTVGDAFEEDFEAAHGQRSSVEMYAAPLGHSSQQDEEHSGPDELAAELHSSYVELDWHAVAAFPAASALALAAEPVDAAQHDTTDVRTTDGHEVFSREGTEGGMGELSLVI
jgi:hypothetical protein